MKTVNIYEAETQLSSLLAKVEQGEDVIIARAGKANARLVSYSQPGTRLLGMDEGKIFIADDFEETPEDLAEYVK